MTAPSLARPGDGVPRPTRSSDLERRTGAVLIFGTLLFALVVQSHFFQFSESMSGDIDYHRGVALTMTARLWQGEAPIHGIISYFGGLYPLSLGWISHELGVSFDALLSVVSWPFTLALPLVLLALGRAIWPHRALEPALLVFIGTVGSSLAFDADAEWVFSALPSGANEWPMYPRDVALVLTIAAVAVVLKPLTWRRVSAAGVLVAAAIATQAQVGLYALVVVAVFATVTTRRAHGWARTAMWVSVTGIVAVAASAWWWVPRLLAALESDRLLLASYPRLPVPDGSVPGLVNAFGIVGLLALGGAVLVWTRTVVERVFGIWLLVFLPVIVFGGPLSDLGVITLRRAWFFAAIPMVVCAVVAATALARALPTIPTVVVLVLAITVPATLEVIHTRNLLEHSWDGPRATGSFGTDRWEATQSSLRSHTVDEHGLVVLAPDVDATFVWQTTGAQPFSLWLSGATKLGFDPASLTPWGYLERVRMQDNAFRAGLPGLCSLAARTGARRVVLRHADSLLGTHDRRPASEYRVGPADRDRASIRRRVGPGLRYIDLNTTEALALERGTSIPVGWSSPAARRLEVYLLGRAPRGGVVLETRSGRVIRPTKFQPTQAVFDVNGIAPGTVIRATSNATVVRTIGFERSPVPLAPGIGAVDLAITEVCR